MKVVLLGDGAVGKTALRERYLGKEFTSSYLMTIGADFAVQKTTVKGKEVKFQKNTDGSFNKKRKSVHEKGSSRKERAYF